MGNFYKAKPEEVVLQDSIHVLHAPSLPAREKHLQYDTYIKMNDHNAISVTLAPVFYFEGMYCI